MFYAISPALQSGGIKDRTHSDVCILKGSGLYPSEVLSITSFKNKKSVSEITKYYFTFIPLGGTIKR